MDWISTCMALYYVHHWPYIYLNTWSTCLWPCTWLHQRWAKFVCQSVSFYTALKECDQWLRSLELLQNLKFSGFLTPIPDRIQEEDLLFLNKLFWSWKKVLAPQRVSSWAWLGVQVEEWSHATSIVNKKNLWVLVKKFEERLHPRPECHYLLYPTSMSTSRHVSLGTKRVSLWTWWFHK